MGHSQMLLAVAGLKEDEVKQLTQKLATGDWSSFPPAEALAFRFGERFTKNPSALTDKDLQTMVATFGRNRTVDLIWYAGWCNYMTRVADGLQLPLERDNVFERPKEK
jgi:hypothetical protein